MTGLRKNKFTAEGGCPLQVRTDTRAPSSFDITWRHQGQFRCQLYTCFWSESSISLFECWCNAPYHLSLLESHVSCRRLPQMIFRLRGLLHELLGTCIILVVLNLHRQRSSPLSNQAKLHNCNQTLHKSLSSLSLEVVLIPTRHLMSRDHKFQSKGTSDHVKILRM